MNLAHVTWIPLRLFLKGDFFDGVLVFHILGAFRPTARASGGQRRSGKCSLFSLKLQRLAASKHQSFQPSRSLSLILVSLHALPTLVHSCSSSLALCANPHFCMCKCLSQIVCKPLCFRVYTYYVNNSTVWPLFWNLYQWIIICSEAKLWSWQNNICCYVVSLVSLTLLCF